MTRPYSMKSRDSFELVAASNNWTEEKQGRSIPFVLGQSPTHLLKRTNCHNKQRRTS